MKRHNLQPSFRESSDSLRPQAASTNLPMPCSPASGNGVYALALVAIASFLSPFVLLHGSDFRMRTFVLGRRVWSRSSSRFNSRGVQTLLDGGM